jgi:6-phosphogluconolactonase
VAAEDAALAEPEFLSFVSPEELVSTVAAAWLDEIAQANQAAQDYSMALSGGRIAAALFAEFRRQASVRKGLSIRAHFFWADERCVPPTDAASNYRVAAEQLFVPLGVATDRIHRIRGEQDPDVAAHEAAAELCRFCPHTAIGQPILDLVLLGMGEDGHVASLFPDEPEAVMSSAVAYRAVTAPKPPPRRVTLGFGVLAAARAVWVVVSGRGKAAALGESLRPHGRTPLARVLRSRPCTRIFSELPRPAPAR